MLRGRPALTGGRGRGRCQWRSGGRDRCRDAGRTAVAHRTQVIAQMQEAGKNSSSIEAKVHT